MMLIKGLPWLCPPPDDFRSACKALATLSDADFAGAARRLASHRLADAQLHQLARAVAARRAAGGGRGALQPLALGLVSNGTTDLVRAALVATGLRYGFDIEVSEGRFGQVMQEALDPQSVVNAAAPDYVLLAVDHRALPITPRPGSVADEQAQVDAAARWIAAACEGFRRNGRATVIVPTLVPSAEPLFGSLDASIPGSLPRIVGRVNQLVAERATAAGDLLLDSAALAALVGLDAWHDAVYWNLGKLPFAQTLVPLYADHVLRLIAAARGKARKCLVLDLDNTLWGGVIGDDGLDGIVLGNGSARGEAFLAVQRLALDLRRRGVLLAVASKNDDATAREPFRAHTEMLLCESDIAVFQANWADKATNLRAIAKMLNIGVDALVLLDDNPAERALVRRELPEVAVPELPEEPAGYPRVLAWAGYFEAASYSTEDAERAGYYVADARRAELAASTTDLDSYLASLDMVMTVAPFGPMARARITQLVNKTNQFNLTTRRYTEQQIRAFETRPGAVTLQIRLADRFGDNGMIGVVIALPDGDVLDIDTWLMSCRVLNRGVEKATLNVLAATARSLGYRSLRGTYLATAKNALVRDHYARLGFVRLADEADRSVWSLPLDAVSDQPCSIRVVIETAG